MPAHKVTLNYTGGGPFGPTPKRITIKPDDTVEFRIGQSTRNANPGCRLQITMHRSQHFSPGVLVHAPGQDNAEPLILTATPNPAVAAAAPVPTKLVFGYKCELLDANGASLGTAFALDGTGGGEIEPDSGFMKVFGT